MNYIELNKRPIPLSKKINSDNITHIINSLPREYSRVVLSIIVNYYLNHPCRRSSQIIGISVPYEGTESENINIKYNNLPAELQLLLKKYLSLIIDSFV